jgi:hypothetical protein
LETQKKSILVIYHSQGGTMELMAHRLARGAAKEKNVAIMLKKAVDATLDDLLNCNGHGFSW